MKRFLIPLLAACTTLTATAQTSRTAESALAEARESLNKAEFSRALELLEEAEKLDPSPAILAEIYYHQGVVKEIRGQLREALLVFYKALVRRAELDTKSARERAKKLLACAAKWANSEVPEAEALRTLETSEVTTCPSVPEPTIEPAPKPDLQPPITATTTPPESPKPAWPLWLAGSVTVASTAIGVGALTHANDQARAANTAAERFDRRTYDDARDNSESASLAKNVAFGVAATAAAATIATAVYYFWPNDL